VASQAWHSFLRTLREANQLLRADPTGSYAARAAQLRGEAPPTSSVELTNALTKGCVLLTSGRLQGCIEAQLQEFLEQIDSSGITPDAIPETLRAWLCWRFLDEGTGTKEEKTSRVHQQYVPLWTTGVPLPRGTIKTDSLPDKVWNPWPTRVQRLLKHCDIDLFARIKAEHGKPYLEDLKTYVDSLVQFRNEVAHGDEPAPWTAADVRLRMQWAVRLARACDHAIGDQLQSITGTSW
jgi:hypothetical protein